MVEAGLAALWPCNHVRQEQISGDVGVGRGGKVSEQQVLEHGEQHLQDYGDDVGSMWIGGGGCSGVKPPWVGWRGPPHVPHISTEGSRRPTAPAARSPRLQSLRAGGPGAPEEARSLPGAGRGICCRVGGVPFRVSWWRRPACRRHCAGAVCPPAAGSASRAPPCGAWRVIGGVVRSRASVVMGALGGVRQGGHDIGPEVRGIGRPSH